MFQYILFNDIFINSETREELEFHTMNYYHLESVKRHFFFTGMPFALERYFHGDWSIINESI